jgi:hypothetical protein
VILGLERQPRILAESQGSKSKQSGRRELPSLIHQALQVGNHPLFSIPDPLERSVECPRIRCSEEAYYKSSAVGRFSPHVAAVIEHSLAGDR